MTEEAAPFIICAMSDIPSQRAKGFMLAEVGEDGKERPLNILVVRWGKHVFGYKNICPHDKVNLDWERDTFLDSSYGTRIMCGKHGALFDIATGDCVDGPCKGDSLEPVALAVIDGDICIIGVNIAEDIDDDEESCEDTEQ